MRTGKSLILMVICLLLVISFMTQIAFASTTPILSGTGYVIPDVTKTSNISLFNNQLSIKFPAGQVITSNGSQASDQSVTTAVYFPAGNEGKYSAYYSIASNKYTMSVASSVYQLLSPAQLTIKYNDNVTSSMADQLSIWYSDKPDFKGTTSAPATMINLGGISNSSSKTVTVPISTLLKSTTAVNNMYNGYFAIFLSQAQFDEFEKAGTLGWAYVSVMPLWSKGIMEPLPTTASSTEFGLQKNINRLEFTTMLVKSLGLKLPTTATMFNDKISAYTDLFNATNTTKFSDYYQIYKTTSLYHIYSSTIKPSLFIEEAAKDGIINGYSDGSFRPQNSITREEAASILARAANLKLENDPDKIDTQLAKLFADYNEISPWARPSVLAASKAKLIAGVKDSSDTTGKTYQFLPNGSTGLLSRAQAATLIYRLMKNLKKI